MKGSYFLYIRDKRDNVYPDGVDVIKASWKDRIPIEIDIVNATTQKRAKITGFLFPGTTSSFKDFTFDFEEDE